MMNVLSCITYDHNLWLVAVSAFICLLGCVTKTMLLARVRDVDTTHRRRWIAFAAVIFGCSIWSLHFVAMLAFEPAQEMAYDLGLTSISIVVAAGGTMLALMAWHLLAGPKRIALGGLLIGLAITGMHYIGVAAMSFAGFLLLDWNYVAASVAVSVVFATFALARADRLDSLPRRLEVAGWLSLAICGLHFTGMTAITVVPGFANTQASAGTVLGTTTLAIAVGSVSVIILLASLAAIMVERRLTQQALQDLDRMRLLSNLAKEVLFIHRDGIVLEVNRAGERLFKAPAGELIGRPVLSLFTEQTTPLLVRRSRCPPQEREPEEVTFQAVDGTQGPAELSCQPIQYLGSAAIAVALRDLSEAKRDEARMRYLARVDTLTDLPNRHTLLERLDIALDSAAQHRGSVAIAYIDLDRFKVVNDLYGHAAGDALLIQASKRVLAEIGPSDTFARIGGDEFALILTGDPQPERVSAVANRIVEALGRAFQIEGHRIEIGASIGIAFYPDDGATRDTLLRAADAAMYRVKQEGRCGLRFYEASMNASLQLRLQLEQELAGAIERGELILHYQPLVNGITGEVETFEALIRWQHPSRGMIPPSDFIPLAEGTGLIDGIGRWVVEQACRDAAAWEQPWRVSLNVSPSQFRRSDLTGIIANGLRVNALNPERIVVEVTEGVLIEDTAKAVMTLNRLRDLGVRIALDDFGTGYSSLSYLQLFRFDKIKIDKSFIRKLGQNEDALTLTRAIVNLGHNLGLHVTAEGVETQTQLDMLQTLGCDQIQGFLVARPAPMGAFTELNRARVSALFAKGRQRRAGEL